MGNVNKPFSSTRSNKVERDTEMVQHYIGSITTLSQEQVDKAALTAANHEQALKLVHDPVLIKFAGDVSHRNVFMRDDLINLGYGDDLTDDGRDLNHSADLAVRMIQHPMSADSLIKFRVLCLATDPYLREYSDARIKAQLFEEVEDLNTAEKNLQNRMLELGVPEDEANWRMMVRIAAQVQDDFNDMVERRIRYSPDAEVPAQKPFRVSEALERHRLANQK